MLGIKLNSPSCLNENNEDGYVRGKFMHTNRLVPRSQKDSRSRVCWVQGLGPWWILDLARPFCRGTLETQDLKIMTCRKTLETQDLKILIYSETLETQDLKILTVTRPWKPRILKFGYVVKPWKPRNQNLKILMSREFKIFEPYTIKCRISCWALCQEVQQVMNSDDRTLKTWIVKKIIQVNGPTLPAVGCRW